MIPRLLTFLFLTLLPAGAADGVRMEFSGVPVELVGVGEKMMPEVKEALEQEIRLSGDTAPTPPLADDLAYFVLQRYVRRGYADARTDWAIDSGRAILTITEGPLSSVCTVRFPGASAVEEKELTVYLTRQTKEREGAFPGTLPYVESDIQAGTGLVARRLQAEGYLNAEAADPVTTRNEETGAVDISVKVTEGPVFTFGTVTVDGDTAPLTKDTMALAEALRGGAFSEVRLENTRKQIAGLWQKNGWFKVEVKATAFPDRYPGGAVPVHFAVDHGSQFRIGGLEIADGFSPGARRVVTSVLGAATGEVYAPDSLDLLHRRALETGVFSTLEVDPQPTGPDTLALRITGGEAKPKTLGLYGGYETFTGPIVGAEVRHVNFMDSGNALALRGEVNGRGWNGSLRWIDPAIFSTRNSLAVDLSAQTFSWKDYDRKSLELRSTLTRRFTRRITAEAFAAISLNKVDTAVLTPEELGPSEYLIESLGGRITLDFRDSPLSPERGWLVTGEVEGGAMSREASTGFLRTSLTAAWYQPLTEHLRFAIGGKMSAISGAGDISDLPIDTRQFNGGANSVRSFPERELGMLSRSGTPLGGLSSQVLSAELSWEVLSGLEIAAFGDAGSLSRTDSSGFASDADFRYAIGGGLRYKLPIGPLRLDYGWNPDRRSGEPAGAFHLTFGFAF